jgi:hypothetical protein
MHGSHMATAEQSDGLDIGSVSTLHWIGIVLAVITGAIHFYLVTLYGLSAFGVAFLVAGIGFLVGAIAILTNTRRRLFVVLGIPFTAGQIVIWYVVNMGDLGTTGIVDKVVQVLLVVVLLVLYQRGSR